MDNTQKEFIFDQILTESERSAYLEKIGALIDSLYSTKSDIKTRVNSLFSLDECERLFRYCQDLGIDIKNPEAFSQELARLKKEIGALETIELHLSFAPKIATLQLIARWFAQNNMYVVFTIVVDTSLLGGAIIGFKGKYHDYSLQKYIEEKYQSIT